MEQQACLKYSFKNLGVGMLFVLYFAACSEKEEVIVEVVSNDPQVVYVSDPDKVLEGPVISCPQQIINMRDGGLLFLKLGIQHSELTRLETENVLIARYLDGIIQVASGYSKLDLSKKSGKDKLKEELLTKLNELAKSDATVSNIYFESILVR